MKNKISSFIQLIYPETVIIAIFMLIQLIIGPNRIFLVAIIVLLAALYKYSRNFLNALWLGFLATLPFARGRYYEFIVLPQSMIGASEDLTFSIPILFSDALLVVIIYLLLSRYNKYRTKYSVSLSEIMIFISLFTFFIIAAISTYFSSIPFTSSYFYLQLGKLAIIFIISLIIFSDKQAIKKTFQILLLFVIANALLVVLQYLNRGPLGLIVEDLSNLYGVFASESRSLYRPGGFSADPNIAATIFAVFIPIILLNTLATKKKWNVVAWVGIGIIFTALVITASRSAWAVAVLSVLITVWFLRKQKKLYVPAYLQSYWKILAVTFLILFGPFIANRLSSLGNVFQHEGGGTYRIRHLEVGWHYLKNEPYGVGVGLFPFSMALDFPMEETGLRPTLPHNIFTQIGAEMGFVGLLTFIVFLWLLIRRPLSLLSSGMRSVNPFYFSIFLGFISLFLLNLVFPWFLHPSIGWLFWILGAYVHKLAV